MGEITMGLSVVKTLLLGIV